MGQYGSEPIALPPEQGTSGGREYVRTLYRNSSGAILLENWEIRGAQHAWSGGSLAGSYADPAGPDASREMVRFFLARKRLHVSRSRVVQRGKNETHGQKYEKAGDKAVPFHDPEKRA